MALVEVPGDRLHDGRQDANAAGRTEHQHDVAVARYDGRGNGRARPRSRRLVGFGQVAAHGGGIDEAEIGRDDPRTE